MADKYLPLTQYLRKLAERGQDVVELSFADLDAMVHELPPSARALRTWWGNSSHVQALAWRHGGFHVETVSLDREHVRFARGHVGGTRHGRAPATASYAPDGTLTGAPALLPLADPITVEAIVRPHAAGRITLDVEGKPVFPQVLESPGLYWLTLTGAALDRPQCYVGETVNLRRRLHSNYRSPGPTQRTSLRINELLRSHLAAAGLAELALATDAEVVIDGSRQALDLSRKVSRLLAENAVLLSLHHQGEVDIVNL